MAIDPYSEPERFGQVFIFRVIAGLLVVAVIYVVAHASVPNPKITWDNFATFDPSGEVTFKNFDEMDWYIGTDRAKVSIDNIRDRNVQIAEANLRLRADLHRVSDALAQVGKSGGIDSQVRQGHYAEAFESLDHLVSILSLESRQSLNTAAIGDRLFDLQRMASTQKAALEDLTPPVAQLFFWTSPNLAVMEVLFWGLFGVVTNLLVNAAEYLRKREYVMRERFVAYTKVVYGPILAMVLVLAILFGWFDLGPYTVRVWTLPLVGFIFGYCSRRTATLFDKIQDKVFGAAEKSVEEGPGPILEARRRNVERLREAARPLTLTDLRRDAKQLAGEDVAIASASTKAES
jgi:hypothetical protein